MIASLDELIRDFEEMVSTRPDPLHAAAYASLLRAKEAQRQTAVLQEILAALKSQEP